VLAATPPPDIDVPRWEESLAAIAGLGPASLFLTHFGDVPDAAGHLTRYRAVLRRAADRAREAVRAGGEEPALTEAWVGWLRADARTVAGEDAAAALEAAAPFDQIWQGLARYWRKRAERDGAGRSTRPSPEAPTQQAAAMSAAQSACAHGSFSAGSSRKRRA
jgi:hypothetical protein